MRTRQHLVCFHALARRGALSTRGAISSRRAAWGAPRSTSALPRNGRVGEFGGAVLGILALGYPIDPDRGITRAPAEEAATPPFVQDNELNFFSARAELFQCPVKGVFDGFAACFG